MNRDELAFLAFTDKGEALARQLAKTLGGEVSRCGGAVGLKQWTAEKFPHCKALVYVGATGIAVRAVAPHLVSKLTDPAVVVVDEGGRFVIPLVSGHLGGANALACRIAHCCQGIPVLTTATDINGRFAVDLWAKRQQCAILNPGVIKRVSAAILAGKQIRVYSDYPIMGTVPPGVSLVRKMPCEVRLSLFPESGVGLQLVPKIAVLGIGCRKGTTQEQLEDAFARFAQETGLCPACICWVASIDLKQKEPGLQAFCAAHGWPFVTVSAQQLRQVEGTFSASAFVRSVTGVDNVCERAAVLISKGRLVIPKSAGQGITFAVACKPYTPDWRWKDEETVCGGHRARR